MYVCLSDDNFQKPRCRKFIFAYPVQLQVIRVKFVYEGHWVKVTVTQAKNVRRYPANRTLQSQHDYNCPDTARIVSSRSGM